MYFESDVNPSPERIFAYRRTQCKVNSWRLDDGGDPIVVDVRLELGTFMKKIKLLILSHTKLYMTEIDLI